MFIKSGLQKCSSEIIKADLNSAIDNEQSGPKVVKNSGVSYSFKRRHLFHREVRKNGKAKLNSLEI